MPDLTPDLAELRRLAEAATPGPWTTAAFQLVIDVARRIDVGMCGHRDDAAYIAAANPAVVLALLDERDALAADADKWQRAALTLQGDRDALTDERDSLSWQVEALRAERDARSSERDALAAKVERVRELHKSSGDAETQGYTGREYGYISPYCMGEVASDEYGVPWPCETIRAIDGAES